MATFSGSSDALCADTPMSRSSSSTGASKETSLAETSLAETSPMDGLQDVPIYQYTGFRNLQGHVRSQSTQLKAGRSNQQYLVLRGVTKDDLAKIDNKRAMIGKHTRMTHHTDIDLLIIKLMPSAEHEIAHLTLAEELMSALNTMGLPRRSLCPIGGTKFRRPNSSKEGDSAYKPASRTQKDDWPTIIFESGLSEGLGYLRNDAQWWLANSGGDVKIAIIISITPSQKRLQVEKWCLSPAPGYPVTRANPNPNTLVPTNIQTITITHNPAAPPNPTGQSGTTAQPSITIQQGATASYAVTGAPLILEFQNLLLRAPIPPEGDVVFTAADLSLWADYFWGHVM